MVDTAWRRSRNGVSATVCPLMMRARPAFSRTNKRALSPGAAVTKTGLFRPPTTKSERKVCAVAHTHELHNASAAIHLPQVRIVCSVRIHGHAPSESTEGAFTKHRNAVIYAGEGEQKR